MITERGTVKTATRIDRRVNKELNGAAFKAGIVCIVLGGILVLISLVCTVIDFVFIGEGDDLLLCLYLGILVLAIGVTSVLTHNKNLQFMEKVARVQEYEFFQTYLITREFCNGEQVSVVKTYYSMLANIKETRSFLFLYNTRVTAYAVDKSTLTPEEYNTIYALVHTRGGAPVGQGGSGEGVGGGEVPPDDPFQL